MGLALKIRGMSLDDKLRIAFFKILFGCSWRLFPHDWFLFILVFNMNNVGLFITNHGFTKIYFRKVHMLGM